MPLLKTFFSIQLVNDIEGKLDKGFIFGNAKNGKVIKAKEALKPLIEKVSKDMIARGESAIVGSFNNTVLSFLKEKNILPESNDILLTDKKILHSIREAKQGKHLTNAELENIPEYIESPEAILFDKTKQNVLYVVSSNDGRKIKIVIIPNYFLKSNGKVNNVITTGKVNGYNLTTNEYKVISGDIK